MSVLPVPCPVGYGPATGEGAVKRHVVGRVEHLLLDAGEQPPFYDRAPGQ